MASDEIKSRSRPKSLAPRIRLFLLGGILLVPLAIYGYSWLTFPSDKTPEGAYLRIVKAVNQGKPEGFFAYTEEAAQHACFTIQDYRKKILEVARQHYPPEQLLKLEDEYGSYAAAVDGAALFALMVHKEGWLSQLRRDVSGIVRTEEKGPRATVVTSKGTRYAMRRRPGGIWGLTAFTPTLVDEAERAARDLEQVEKAAEDFARAKSSPSP